MGKDMFLKFVNDNILPVKQFLLLPIDEKDNSISNSMKVVRFVVVLSIDVLIGLIVLGLLSVFQGLKLLDIESHKMNDIIKQFPVLFVLITGVILLPAFEELIFRFFLRFNRFNPLKTILNIFNKNKNESMSDFEYSKFVWDKYYKIIYYSSAILFGLYHLTNYKITLWIIIFTPILVLSQIVMGLLCGYLRVKFNFLWGMSLHILHNFIFLAIPLIMMGGESNIINVKTKDYNLVISETKFNIDNSSIHSNDILDSLIIDNVELKEIIPFFLKKDAQLIEFNNIFIIKTTLKIHYSSFIKDRISNRDTILKYLKQLYKFDIETISQSKQIWELRISDSIKSSKYISDKTQSISSSIMSSNDSIKVVYVNLQEIAKFIGSIYKTYIDPGYNSEIKYSFKIKAHDFESFKSEIEKIGIKLIQNNSEVEITKIKFE
jgi:hypothetical protein